MNENINSNKFIKTIINQRENNDNKILEKQKS
jgi:hypothetical protein